MTKTKTDKMHQVLYLDSAIVRYEVEHPLACNTQYFNCHLQSRYIDFQKKIELSIWRIFKIA